MRRCCETTSCCQACGSPAMHWRTSLLTASCSASCSGVRCNFASGAVDGGSSVSRAAATGVSSGCGEAPPLPGRGSLGAGCRGLRRPPEIGIAMCRTPMHIYTHGRERWFNLVDGGEHAAREAVASVSGGIGLHVVGLLVDDDGGAAVG